MNKDGSIDFSKLEKQLLVAVDEDARYQRENDAKFRAVAQKVGSYEEFKDIVAASHLKPLEKKDIAGLHNRKQPWNICADKTSEKTEFSKDSITTGDDIHFPKNNHEFQKYWRKCRKDKVTKYQYLIHIGGSTLTNIFQAEISMGLLGELSDVLNENWDVKDFSKICGILHSLSTVKRFSLSLQFLSSKEKQTLVELFQKLNKAMTVIEQNGVLYEGCVSVDSLKKLEDSYGVMRDELK